MTTFNSSGDTGNNGDSASQGSSFQQNSAASQGQESTGDGGNSHNVDVAKLAKRLDDSQAFIETLKSERQADRELIQDLQSKLTSTPTVDEIMEQINQRSTASNDNLDPDDLVNKAAEAVESRLNKAELDRKASENFNSVASALSEKFGEKEVDSKVRQLAQDNGMTFDQVVEMAKTSPKAVLKLLGVSSAEPTSSGDIPSGSINTGGVGYENTGENKPIGSIVNVTTDRGRVDMTAEYFKKHGLEF
jgi:small-conductance mechanosensitive channel